MDKILQVLLQRSVVLASNLHDQLLIHNGILIEFKALGSFVELIQRPFSFGVENILLLVEISETFLHVLSPPLLHFSLFISVNP